MLFFMGVLCMFYSFREQVRIGSNSFAVLTGLAGSTTAFRAGNIKYHFVLKYLFPVVV